MRSSASSASRHASRQGLQLPCVSRPASRHACAAPVPGRAGAGDAAYQRYSAASPRATNGVVHGAVQAGRPRMRLQRVPQIPASTCPAVSRTYARCATPRQALACWPMSMARWPAAARSRRSPPTAPWATRGQSRMSRTRPPAPRRSAPAWPPAARPVVIGQAAQPGLGEPPAPLPQRHPRRPQLRSFSRDTRSRLGARQDNLSPLGQHRRTAP